VKTGDDFNGGPKVATDRDWNKFCVAVANHTDA
jgi:hypothetical protein